MQEWKKEFAVKTLYDESEDTKIGLRLYRNHQMHVTIIIYMALLAVHPFQ